jgi:hypothetical protein
MALTSAGGSYQLTGAVIDWTVGEWIVETHTEEPYLEQGFLHAFNLFPDVPTSIASNASRHRSEIWPNPASEYFRLKTDPGISDELLLIDAGGTFIGRWKTDGQSRLFNVAGIPSGQYQVLILNNKQIIGYTHISIIH